MKLTKQRLNQIIKEELQKVLNEASIFSHDDAHYGSRYKKAGHEGDPDRPGEVRTHYGITKEHPDHPDYVDKSSVAYLQRGWHHQCGKLAKKYAGSYGSSEYEEFQNSCFEMAVAEHARTEAARDPRTGRQPMDWTGIVYRLTKKDR